MQLPNQTGTVEVYRTALATFSDDLKKDHNRTSLRFDGFDV